MKDDTCHVNTIIETSNFCFVSVILMQKSTLKNIYLSLLLCVTATITNGQAIYGTVADDGSLQPLAGAIVINKANHLSTATGNGGDFTIAGATGDTLIFSHVGYHTQFRIARKDSFMYIKMDAFTIQLQEHVIQEYTMFQKDSIILTTLYSKELNAPTAKVGYSDANGGGVTGLIGTPIKRMSKAYKRNKQFQQNFKKDLEQKFIDTRYTPTLVQNLTGLRGDTLFTFINANPMTYEFARNASDMEIKMWIRDNYKNYVHKILGK
jgi:CarboxypepD_reg-like domain